MAPAETCVGLAPRFWPPWHLDSADCRLHYSRVNRGLERLNNGARTQTPGQAFIKVLGGKNSSLREGFRPDRPHIHLHDCSLGCWGLGLFLPPWTPGGLGSPLRRETCGPAQKLL